MMPITDRYAIHTRTQYGEQIASGACPDVTDEERAAAGRETLARRSRELRDLNRRAAAERALVAPDAGQPVLRIWQPREAESLRARLVPGPFAMWAEGDVLHMLWRGAADRVELTGGLQAPMWPVDGTADLWEASFRAYRLDEAIVSAAAIPLRAGQPAFGQRIEPATWRGPRAPSAPPDYGELASDMEEHRVGAAGRPVSVYLMPGEQPRWGCVLADGQSAGAFAASLRPAILAGEVPPVLIVGVHSDTSRPGGGQDMRSQEYVPRLSRRRFDAHLHWVTAEVIPWAVSRYGAVSRWTASGYSNGAVWAIAAGQRRPDIFGSVAAFSAGVPRRRVASRQVRHYLAAGLYEESFNRATRQWADHLDRAGVSVCYEQWVGGHDFPCWCLQFRRAMTWLAS